jgi:hypothetical protein
MPSPPADSGGIGGAQPPPDPERAWRESFNQFERMIGKPLEAFMQSPEFADAAAKYLQTHSDIRTEMEKSSPAWLQMWQVASAGDVQELRRELDELRSRLDELERRGENGGR